MMSAPDVGGEVLRTIGALFQTGDVIEIRGLDVGRRPNRPGITYAGYFNFENAEAIRKAVRELDGRAEGVYVILNPFNPTLLARANNRLQAGLRQTTSDKDIIQWRWLYIDCDSERPAGISATDQEHKAALDRAATIREFLSNRGWPAPIYSDWGSGGHLLFLLPALDLERARQLVKLCLKALATRFSDALVKVDESTSNAARLCKLYGTMTRKGDAMPDRPHRRSRIIDDPERIEPVTVEGWKPSHPKLNSRHLERRPRRMQQRPLSESTNGLPIMVWRSAKGRSRTKAVGGGYYGSAHSTLSM
jgi:hypothetical protein